MLDRALPRHDEALWPRPWINVARLSGEVAKGEALLSGLELPGEYKPVRAIEDWAAPENRDKSVQLLGILDLQGHR
ncbi:MAG: hypothetical protein DMF66_07205 [Acidobacteria bacterium]|nr:MAG: hypothetical protein DMF66_07205 [Acidobacteriota bacterium]